MLAPRLTLRQQQNAICFAERNCAGEYTRYIKHILLGLEYEFSDKLKQSRNLGTVSRRDKLFNQAVRRSWRNSHCYLGDYKHRLDNYL